MIRNRKASHDFFFLEKVEAGIALTGSEVKSLRQGKANLQEAFCSFRKGELFVHNMHISPYSQGGYANHEPFRMRKLLLNRKELKQLQKKSREKGITIIPTKVYFNTRNLVKVEIALAQGKKKYDKREAMKEKDLQREMRNV